MISAILFMISWELNKDSYKFVRTVKEENIPVISILINEQMRRLLRWIVISFVVLMVLCTAAVALSLALFRENLIQYLSVNQSVPDEYLVVEGWVDDLVLDSAVRIFESGEYLKIIATGSSIDPDFLMSTNGLLEFQLKDEKISLQRGDSIRVCLKGTPVLGIYPSVTILINGESCYEGFASANWSDHVVVMDKALQIDELGIYFGNDDFLGNEDRNLHIRSITLDGRVIPARSEYSFQYDKSDQAKQFPSPTNFHSVAAICAHKLELRGIPGDRIVVLPSPKYERTRTLSSAYAVSQWISSSALPETTCLNIMSESIHSRRSYILYRMALKKDTGHIGIISIALEKERYLGFTIDNRDIIRELAGTFYYRFLFNKRRFEKRISAGGPQVIPGWQQIFSISLTRIWGRSF
jgi:hypothetical protein